MVDRPEKKEERAGIRVLSFTSPLASPWAWPELAAVPPSILHSPNLTVSSNTFHKSTAIPSSLLSSTTSLSPPLSLFLSPHTRNTNPTAKPIDTDGR